MTHPAQLSLDELLSECSTKQLRRGGPGGQHRNKVETAVSIEHLPTGLRSEASERRSQADNRRVAIQRLRLILAVEHRSQAPQESDAAAPSSRWKDRAVNGRIQVSTEHDDFPAILAELLDHLAACGYDVPASSQYFGVSSSQLIGLLRSHPPALAAVNAARALMGNHKLR